MEKLPEGVSPNDVKIEFDFYATSMSYETHYVKFYYEKKIPAREADYKRDLAAYKENLAQYEKDYKAYQEACVDQEIKETEENLRKLKEKKK